MLAITRGLGDALRIGYQNRPDIFARRIVLPEQLYARTVEVEERLRAGTVERPLDRWEGEADLEAAHAEGFRAVAIVLMHGYATTSTSWRWRRSREIRFTQISVSHEVSR